MRVRTEAEIEELHERARRESAEQMKTAGERVDKLVKADVSNGATAAAARVNELHSIACSRTRDDHLVAELRSYCDRVLPGRWITKKRY